MLRIRNNGKSKKTGKPWISFLIFFLLAIALANNTAAMTMSTATPVFFNIPAQNPPQILSYSISPKVVINGTNVTLLADTYQAHSQWATIVRPNGTVENISLSDNVAVNYTTSLVGRYNLTFYARNNAGTVSLSEHFIAGERITWNVSIYDSSLSGLSSEIENSYDGSVILTDTQANGNYSNEVAGWIYNVLFKAYSGDLELLLRDVNISVDNNQAMGLDKTNLTGYLIAYAIDNNNFTTLSNATLTISYNGTGYTDEDNLGLYRCDNWNFTSRTCLGTFTSVSATQSKVDKTFTIELTTFSAFAIKQETAPVTAGGGGGGACTDQCEFGEINCVGPKLYRECAKVGACTKWIQRAVENGYECKDDKIRKAVKPFEPVLEIVELPEEEGELRLIGKEAEPEEAEERYIEIVISVIISILVVFLIFFFYIFTEKRRMKERRRQMLEYYRNLYK